MKMPEHLSDEARNLWAYVEESFHLEHQDFLRLRAACEAWDRLQQARRQLAESGPFYEDRFGAPRAHPAVALERDSRIGFMRSLREIGLDVAAGAGDMLRPPRVAAIGGRK